MTIGKLAVNAFMLITGRKALKYKIDNMRDDPECLGCNKITHKLVEEKLCFQCFYDKSDEIH